MEYVIDKAIGFYVIVEPMTKSSVLRAEEVATVFRVLSTPDNREIKSEYSQDENKIMQNKTTFITKDNNYRINDLIIVAPNSVESTMMENEKVYFVRESDIIAKVRHGQQSDTPNDT